MPQDNTVKNILLIFLIVLIFYLLNVLSSIILPFVLALLLALLFQPLIMFLLRLKLPRWLILPVISFISLSIVFGITMIIANTISDIISEKEFLLNRLAEKGELIMNWINSAFHANLDAQFLIEQMNSPEVSTWLQNTAQTVASKFGYFISDFLFFALYYVMLLAGMSNYQSYIRYVGGDKGESMLEEYGNIQHSVFKYMYLKTLINIVVGLITYGMCMLYGVKFAVFWGFVAFVFNYIPTVGTILGTVMPITMSIVQLDSFQEILLIAVTLIALHFIMGNIIEPIIMGNSLRINTLTVLIGLVFWGYLWGIPGMMLSVPLLVITKIILERIPSLSMVGRLMGYSEK